MKIGVPLAFDYGDLRNLLSPSNATSSSNATGNSNTIKTIKLSDIQNDLRSPVRSAEQINFSLGVYSHFNSTWGNLQTGVSLCAYVSAETSVVFSKSMLDSALVQWQNQIGERTLNNIPVNLSLFSFPPIQIGVITLRININGGFQIPVKIYADAKLSTTYFVGFTGLYGAGLDLSVN